MTRVVYTAEALGDVAHVLVFIASHSPVQAAEVAARIDTAVRTLGIFPRAARFDRKTGVYERPITGLPLLLVYTVSDRLVEVMGVFHTSRDPVKKRQR